MLHISNETIQRTDSAVDSVGSVPEQVGLGQLKNFNTLTVVSSRDHSYSKYSRSLLLFSDGNIVFLPTKQW